MDYPSGTRQTHAGSLFASHRGHADGGGPVGPLQTDSQMNSWDENAFLLGSVWQSSLSPNSSDPPPDRAHPCPRHASPNLAAASVGGGAMMPFSILGTTSAWTCPGRRNLNGAHATPGVPFPRDPTTYQDLVSPPAAGQFIHSAPQWPQHFYSSGFPTTAQSHTSPAVDRDLETPLTSPPPTSTPSYAALPAPTPVRNQGAFVDDSPQPYQYGYYQAPPDSVFFIKSPRLNQWQVSGPPPTQNLPSTISAPDAASLSAPFHTTFYDRGGSGPASIDANAVSPSPESHYALSPASALSRDRRGSTASTDITVPDSLAELPPPTPLGQRKQPKPPPATCFEFVLFKPEAEAGQNGSRKRPAEDYPPGAASQTLREVIVKGENGEFQGAMTIFGRREKKRATFSDEKKERVKIVRRAGVCDRCKKAKKGCDLALKESPYVPCDLCGSTELYKGVQRMPCFQSKLEELLFFRSGPAQNEPLYTNRRMVYSLGDISKNEALIKTVKLTQDIGDHCLTVYASEFEPVDGDVLSYHWEDPEGNAHVMDMPRYSLTAIDKVKNHISRYIETAKHSYLQSLKADGDLIWMTVSVAVHYAKARPGSLTQSALDLWAVCRMIEIPWTIRGAPGEETLGIERVADKQNPRFGTIPIPPTMDTQLDQVVIKHALIPLREKLIKRFNEIIKPPSPEAWFDTYLASFMLLNHIEHLAKHSVDHAKLHAVHGKYSNIPFLEGALHWAKIILSRFHFVCNGSIPLNMDWSTPEAAKMANLSGQQVRFMMTTQKMIAAKEDDVVALRKKHKYEGPLYWCHQLFVKEWDKSPAHVVEEED